MTTNTNTRTPARFFASTTANADGLFTITDRTDDTIVTAIKGRAHARFFAARLTEADPAPRVEDEATEAPAAKADAKRTSHADCDHASSKLARATCRRNRAKADA